MRIGLRLNLMYTTAISGGSLSRYAVAGFEPELVADFDDEYYRANRSRTTFDGLLTHSRLSNATMVDSDGVLKWGPHNLLTYSEALTTANSWFTVGNETTRTIEAATAPNGETLTLIEDSTTVTGNHGISKSISNLISGVKYNFRLTCRYAEWQYCQINLGPSISYVDLQNGTVPTNNHNIIVTDQGGGYYTFEGYFTSAGTTTTLYILPTDTTSTSAHTGVVGNGTYVGGVQLYRSDLGGMVNNPDRGDSYVPTTSSARYLPRRGHHVWNGSAWVNEGLLIETESRTNLLTYSNNFADAAWTDEPGNGAIAADATGPDGQISATTLQDSVAGGVGRIGFSRVVSYTINTPHTMSVFAKADGISFLQLRTLGTTSADGSTWFDLSTGVVGTKSANHSASITALGNGWYRCSITFTTDAVDTTGTVFIYGAQADNVFDVDLDGTSSILIYGAQFEQGSTPSSYIPTSGATVNRTPDILTIPSANLPWPTPKVIGPELVTNGTFDTDTSGWATLNTTTFEVSGGRLRAISSAGVRGSVTTTVSGLTIGRVYKLSFDYESNDSLYDSVGLDWGVVAAGSGSFDFAFLATSTSESIVFAEGTVATSSEWFLDNISVREINPLAVSIQMDGRMTYADNNGTEAILLRWDAGSGNNIYNYLMTFGASTGFVRFYQSRGGTIDQVDNESAGPAQYSPGINVPYNIASRHGSTFINGAVDGTSLTANLTPVALPDLSATNLSLAYDYMGCIKLLRIWSVDLGDAGIAEASS